MKNKIYPCLWFDGNAIQAAQLYSEAFMNTKITTENPMVVTFDLAGQNFMCLNGGPDFKPNPSISFYVLCETFDEVDSAWNKLIDGGNALMPLEKYEWSKRYGWVQDRFGVSWQLSYGKISDVGQKVSPSFLFTGKQAGNAKSAMEYYTSLFEDSKICQVIEYTKDDPDEEGYVKFSHFNLFNQVFIAMDSSMPHNFQFNEGISLVVSCEDQKEIDHLWDKLTADGQEGNCGWLKDQFGVSWQIVPTILGDLMSEPEKAEQVTKAFMKMKKLDIKELISV